MEQRRKFLKGIGLFGAVATAVVAGRTAVVGSDKPKADPKMIDIIEHQQPANITLTSTYGEIAPPPPPTPPSQYAFHSDGSVTGITMEPTWATQQLHLGTLNVSCQQHKFVPGTEKQVALKLVPGPDGKLYLNINGEWKEVLTT
jgi:hypothetical protein